MPRARPRSPRVWIAAAITVLSVAVAVAWWRPSGFDPTPASTPTAASGSAPSPAEVTEIQPDASGLALPKSIGSLRFAVMGDVGRGDRAQYDTANEMARWRDRFEFQFVLMLGDNNYGPGSPEEYAARFERPYKALLDAGVTFYAVLGNHDPPDQQHYAPYNMHGDRYYTFTRAEGALKTRQVQFFAIDTVTLDRAQLSWLDREMAASRADWKIAFFHHPLYTSGRYGVTALRMRHALEPIFVRNGLDVALAGHEHFYERLTLQRGIQYFISGAAGALRVGDIRDSSITAAGFDADTHFILMEIADDLLYFQAISRTGRTVDAGRLQRAEHPAPPPALRR
ncbi:MAG TPA: metallophosphoesterase [Vicinamibacterales bacterium]|nr:metallophosphoesterase [Vicinamibacterales bacterium]